MSPRDYSLDVEDAHQNSSHRVVWTGTKDDGDQQLVSYKGLYGEEHTDVVRVQPHGFSSHPPKNSEGVLVSIAGRDMPMAFGGESPTHRPRNLPEGATKIYDASGTFIYMDAAGKLNIESTAELNIKTGSMTIEGSLIVKGDITHTGNMTTSGIHTDANGPHTA